MKTSNNCQILHEWCNSVAEYYFPFDSKIIPKNGIYIVFEKGEFAHGGKRIVRVGTHTGDHQLVSRLKQHFVNQNKDRSIFRKNIGRALLIKDNDPFIDQREIDLTTKASREHYADSIDSSKQQLVEQRVSNYIQQNLSFITIPIVDKKMRLNLESKIISSISFCEECQASEHRLGNYSPKDKIKKSGLRLVNELWKVPLDQEDMTNLEQVLLGEKQ